MQLDVVSVPRDTQQTGSEQHMLSLQGKGRAVAHVLAFSQLLLVLLLFGVWRHCKYLHVMVVAAGAGIALC